MIKSALARGPVLALALFAALCGCATRQEAPLSAATDNGRSCTELATEFRRADAAAADRRTMARKADISLGTSAVVLAIATQGGIAIPLAAVAIQQSRSDFGYARFTQAREHYRSVAADKGCTQEMAEMKPMVQEPVARRSTQGTGAVPFVFGGN
jgi:hypothetical protein